MSNYTYRKIADVVNQVVAVLREVVTTPALIGKLKAGVVVASLVLFVLVRGAAAEIHTHVDIHEAGCRQEGSIESMYVGVQKGDLRPAPHVLVHGILVDDPQLRARRGAGAGAGVRCVSLDDQCVIGSVG